MFEINPTQYIVNNQQKCAILMRLRVLVLVVNGEGLAKDTRFDTHVIRTTNKIARISLAIKRNLFVSEDKTKKRK